MDLGLFNKAPALTQRGEHGTLIGNWVEERALYLATGENRHQPLPVQKIQNPDSFLRTCGQRTSAVSSPATEPFPLSSSRLHFPAHSPDHFTPKLFNQTGSSWHSRHSQPASARPPNASQIILGSEKLSAVEWQSENHRAFPNPQRSQNSIEENLLQRITKENAHKTIHTKYNH